MENSLWFSIAVNTALIVLFLWIFLYPKGVLTIRVYEAFDSSGKKLSFFHKLNCYVPLHNSRVIRKALFGRAPVINIVNIVFVLVFSGVFATRFIFQGQENIQLLATGIMFFMFAVLYIVEIFILWDLAGVLDKKGYRFVSIILPMLGAYLLANQVRKYYREHKDEIEETFEGGKG